MVQGAKHSVKRDAGLTGSLEKQFEKVGARIDAQIKDVGVNMVKGAQFPNPSLELPTKRVIGLSVGSSILTMILACVLFFTPGQVQYFEYKTLMLAFLFSLLMLLYVRSALRRNSTYLMFLFCFCLVLSLCGLSFLAPSL